MVIHMKNILKNIQWSISAAAVVFVSSCAPDIESPSSSAVQANFSKYIAIGNSLTAGFADGGLYLEGQQVAYPNLIAEQLKAVGGGEFKTPFFSQEQHNGSGYLSLKALVDGQPVMENVTNNLAIRGLTPNGAPLYTKYTDQIHNFGVPGMRLDMAFAPGIGSVLGNPYFERLLPDNTPPETTYFGHVTSQEYTFFSFWLGNNDALGYATNGAFTEGPTSALTQTATFNKLYNDFINKLIEKGQKGVVATIPDVTAIPFFNTVTTARIVAGITASTGGAYTRVYIQTGAGVREATEQDLFGLTFSTDTLGKVSNGIPGYGLIPQNPLHDKFVLDKDEIVEVSTRVNEFNKIIKSAAESKGLALADAHAYLNKVKNPGILYNGIGVNASFITGNAFSLDGVHLTPMGNALIANLFIEAINAKYGSKLSKVDAAQYRGVKFP